MKYPILFFRFSIHALIFSAVFISVGGQRSYAQGDVILGTPVFFETLYDVPVMAGLEEIAEAALSFDKADGRIAQASAFSENLGKEAILIFYNKTLEQMGWQVLGEGKYVREGEKLEIFVEKSKGSYIARFSLQPY